jgi:hypothetical protein
MPVIFNFNTQPIQVLTPQFKNLLLNAGDLLDATVVDVIKSDEVALILKGSRIEPEGIRVVVRTNLPLSAGDTLNLKVTSIGKEITLKALNISKRDEDNTLTEKITEHLFEISSQIKKQDIKALKDFFKNLPEGLDEQTPKLRVLKEIIPKIDSLSHKLLEQVIRDSGLFFEGRIRLSFDKDQELQNIISRDIKGLLLTLKNTAKDKSFLSLLEASGIKTPDFINTLDRFLKIIEFYQYSSFLNNVLYTYLPVDWSELKDGEIVIKKSKDGVYICYISLELDPMGRLGFAVSYLNKSVYISFYSDEKNLSVIKSNQEQLKKRFSNLGLSLMAINFLEKEDMELDLKCVGEIRLKI